MGKKSICFCLKLILWKNWIMRKHNRFTTILEIAVPFVLFAICANHPMLRITSNGETHNISYCKIRDTNLIYNLTAAPQLYYAPNNNFTRILMSKVLLKLKVPSAKGIVTKGFTSDRELMAYYDTYGKPNDLIIAIIFTNTKNRLEYTIRPPQWKKTPWNLEILYMSGGIYVAENGGALYFQFGLIALQMALDTSYIEILFQKELPVNLTMQEFPYPPHKNDGIREDMFQMGMPIVTFLGFILFSSCIVERVMEEKTSGIKELMKMMGLQSWVLWLGWLLYTLIVNIVTIILITVVLTVQMSKGGNPPLLKYCSSSVFAVFLLLYCISLITFAFLLSSIFNSPMIAQIVYMCILLFGGQSTPSPNVELSIKIVLAILFPNALLDEGYQEILNYEKRGIGLLWSNIFISGANNPNGMTMGLAFVIFTCSSILFMIITMYMEIVKPGPYGHAKPPHFPALYIWNKISRNNKVSDEETDEEATDFEHSAKIEPPPKLNVGIAVKNLCKRFGKQKVVNNFSIDFYEGQITILLGHNGAGKTTTMSIITGLISATSGKVIINNKDIQYHMDELRSSLGFCPQINMHFHDINVNEHLIFFAMLKGLSLPSAKSETQELLQKLNLTDKADSLPPKLSGGMKRRLSLGMALCGDSKVLILDEPTSGLDPEARREIWDILLTFRGTRTVIITTHFMEEADVLGDRIAIMDHGKLMCYGTSMYLKKEYGTGYNLTLVRDDEGYKKRNPQGPDQVEALTKIVQGKIKSASIVTASGNRVIFVLPHDMKPSFGETLSAVESVKEELFVTNIALSVTTLEEVFLTVDSTVGEETNTDKTKGNRMGDNKISFVTNPTKKQKGLKLSIMQICCLFKKRLLVLKRKWIVYLVALLVALGAAILTLYIGDHIDITPGGNFTYNLHHYGKSTVYYGIQDWDELLKNSKGHYENLIDAQESTRIQVQNVSDKVLERGQKNIAFYNYLLIVGAEFKYINGSRTANAMYGNRPNHAAPISLNLLTNAVLKAIMGNDYSISTTIWPLPEYDPNLSSTQLTALNGTLMWFLLFPLGILFLTGTFLLFPHMERVSDVKQLQLMCGVRPVIYWLVCYVVDLVLYCISVAVIIMGMQAYALYGTKAYSGPNEIAALLIILCVYGLSIIPFTYLFTYKRTASDAFVWYISLNLVFGLIMTPLLLMAYVKVKFLSYAIYLIPVIPHAGLTLFLTSKFSLKAAMNYNWDQYTLEEKLLKCIGQHLPCCDGDDTAECLQRRSYFSEKKTYTQIWIMASMSLFYFIILLLLESNFVQKLWERFLMSISSHKNKKPPADAEHDREDVSIETKRIADVMKREKRRPNSSNDGELLLVHELHKWYGLLHAVKGVSFAVKSGECFGLLGVNGAGKSTTFHILSGKAPLIAGEVRILTPNKERIFLSTQHGKYFEQVGYCPQFDAMNEFLTGREMLRVFAALRGISDGAEEEINMWIRILGLGEFTNKRCGIYSGGNKRKLNVAIALLGGLPVVMLDEPTSGVDPVSRRKLWNTLSAIQQQEVKPSIILTSHSMEECEALCNNLAIMKSGRLECNGTIPNIKKKYAQGFTVMLKLKTPGGGGTKQNQPTNSRSPTSAEDPLEVTNLMKDIETNYRGYCTLKDKHSGLLHYHINDKSKKWGQIFSEIDTLQKKYPIIEDYNISETTLEQVFLTIARQT